MRHETGVYSNVISVQIWFLRFSFSFEGVFASAISLGTPICFFFHFDHLCVYNIRSWKNFISYKDVYWSNLNLCSISFRKEVLKSAFLNSVESSCSCSLQNVN